MIIKCISQASMSFSPLRMSSHGTRDAEDWWLSASCLNCETLRARCTQRSSQHSGEKRKVLAQVRLMTLGKVDTLDSHTFHRRLSRFASGVSTKGPIQGKHGWDLYVFSSTETVQIAGCRPTEQTAADIITLLHFAAYFNIPKPTETAIPLPSNRGHMPKLNNVDWHMEEEIFPVSLSSAPWVFHIACRLCGLLHLLQARYRISLHNQ